MILTRRLLRDHRRGVIGWGLSITGLVAFTAVFFPSMRDSPEMTQAMEDLPDALKALAGLVGDVSFTSPPGYLHSQLLTTMLPILLLVLGIGLGARETGGVEEDGILESLLSLPVSRRRTWIERWIAIVVLIAAQAVICFAAVLAIGPAFGLLDGVSITFLALACLSAALMATVHAAVAFAVGAATGRRGVAISVAVALAAVGYLAQGLSSLSSAAEVITVVMPWHWYLDRVIIVDGVGVTTVVVPLVVSVAVVTAGGLLFERRDIH